jgi:hypothetical protein
LHGCCEAHRRPAAQLSALSSASSLPFPGH